MTCLGKFLGLVLALAAFTAPLRSFAQAGPETHSAEPPQQAPTDPQAQVTELIRRADQQMNVTGQFQQCAEYAQQAADLALKIGDKADAATALNYLAAALAYQGRLVEARDAAQKDIALARESENKKILEQALNTAAGVAGEAAEYEDAVAYFYQCLEIARAIGDQTMQYMSLLNIGEAYTRSGEPDRAESPLLESLQIAHGLKHGDLKASDPSKKATEMVLLNLGGMEIERGNYSRALDYYTQVHLSAPQSPLWVISALEGMAEANGRLGHPQKAVDLLEEAIPLTAKSSSGLQSARMLSNLGVNQESLGQLDAALASQNRSISMIRAAGGNPDLEWQIEHRLAHVLRSMGRNDVALEHYSRAIEGIERLRSVALATEEGRAGVLAKSHDTYFEMADLLVDLHREAMAFEIAERGHARAFVEMLALIRGGLPDQMTRDQETRESELQARISLIQKALWKESVSASEEEQRKTELGAAEDDLEAFHVAVRRSNPRYASLRYPEPVSVSRVQSELLDNNSVLLEFMIGEKRSLAWIVSKGDLRVAVLPPRGAIERQVAEFRRRLGEQTSLLTAQSSTSRIEQLGTVLYSELLGPIRRSVPPGTEVIVVPDGMLSDLPFEALVAGTKQRASGEVRPLYAVEQYRMSYAPSASALAAVQSLNPLPAQWERTLLAFGDPIVDEGGLPNRESNRPALLRTSTPDSSQDSEMTQFEAYSERGFSLARLPFTREEVLSIGKLFAPSQRTLYLGGAATEGAIKRERLNAYRYIHLASHGFIDESVPSRSGILFSRDPISPEDGVLQASEIMRLKISADLVTLSACNTGLGKLVSGEGILGLTRAFLYAGARHVVVSLWGVNDSSTAALMQLFYANLKIGMPMDEALRRAKLSLLSGTNRSWKQPYFWAAFVLVGKG